MLLNRVRTYTSTTNNGSATLGDAALPHQTWDAAGAVAGNTYSYLIEDGEAWEIGRGIYTEGSLSRPGPGSDTAFQSSTGALLVLSGQALISCAPLAQDIPGATGTGSGLSLEVDTGSGTFATDVTKLTITGAGVSLTNPASGEVDIAFSGGTSAGAGATTLVATSILEAATSNVTFSVPAGYTDLEIRFSAGGDYTGGTDVPIALQLNGDTGNNYGGEQTFNSQSHGTTLVDTPSSAYFSGPQIVTSVNAQPLSYTSGEISIGNYLDTTRSKTMYGSCANRWAVLRDLSYVGEWRNPEAITSIKLFPVNGNFKAGSRFDLYGIGSVAGAGTTLGSLEIDDAAGSVATGVTKLTITGPGATLTSPAAGEVNLVISGGGGSGGGSGGSNLLAYAASDVSSGPQDASAVETGGLLIPGMTTSFTLTETTDVKVSFSSLMERAADSGTVRLMLYIDGAEYVPTDPSQRYYAVDQGDNNVFSTSWFHIVSLAAGAHTVAIWWEDVAHVELTTFWNRGLVVEAMQLATSGGGETTPVVVAADYFRINGSATLNTAVAPTAGNLQVILQTGAGGTAGNSAPPTGFQTMLNNSSTNTGNNPGQAYQEGAVFFRYVPAGAGTAIVAGAADYRNMAVFEVSGAAGLSAFFDTLQTSGEAFGATVLRHSTADLTFLMIENDSGTLPSFDALTGVTQLHQFGPDSGNHYAAVAQLGSAAPLGVTGTFASAPNYPCYLTVSVW
jgi:hypothetical protein